MALPSTNVQQRKVLLAYTRIQPLQLQHSRFRHRYSSMLFSSIYVNYDTRHATIDLPSSFMTTIWYLIKRIQEQLQPYPLLFGFASSLIRQAPYNDYSSVVQTLHETRKKEMEAILGDHSNVPLNFEAWFSSSDEPSMWPPIASNIAEDISTTKLIRSIFQKSKRVLSGRFLYPKLSKKTIGKAAQDQAEQELSGVGYCTPIGTILDVEIAYHRSGYHAEGVVEVRSAWKYLDLKPRVYYAQGPTAFRASKYIQSIVNVILDLFPPVHRKARFQQPIDGRATEDEIHFIYDYDSFSSRLTSLPCFVEALADFYDDVWVTVLDSKDGPQQTSVGSLLRDYSRVCNSLEFDIGRILELQAPDIRRAKTGLLGVPGNIGLSTLLHGLHLASVTSIAESRCIGDDARSKRPVDVSKDELHFQVSNLGIINKEKVEEWSFLDQDDDERRHAATWQYAKRQFYRGVDGRMVTGLLFFFPDLVHLFDLPHDGFHTPDGKSPLEGCKTTLKQWRALLDTVPRPLDPLEVSVLRFVQFHLFKQLRRAAVEDVKECSFFARNYFIGFVPPRLSESEFQMDWRDVALSRLRGSELIAPKPFTYADEVFFMPGFEGRVAFHPMLKWLVDMEYAELESEKLRVERYTTMAWNRAEFDFYVDAKYPVEYKLRIHHNVPNWVLDVYAGLR